MVPTTIIAFTLNIQMDMVEMYMEGKKMDMKKRRKEEIYSTTRQRREKGGKTQVFRNKCFYILAMHLHCIP